MNRVLAVALAMLVVATGVAGGVIDEGLVDTGPAPTEDTAVTASSADPDYMTGTDRTRRLELSGTERSDSVEGSWNLGTRIAASDDVVATTYEATAFENRVTSELPAERREELISDRLQRIESRIVSIRDREQTAVAAYARGDAGKANLTATLVRSHAEAGALEETLARLERISDSESNENFADNLQFRLNTFRSPLRDRLQTATRGSTESVRLSLRASESGYVAGAIIGSEYYREALRYDNRRPSGPKVISSGSDLETRQAAVYNDSTPPGVQRFYKSSGAWVGRMVYTYSDVEIKAFFDGGTGDVFYERTTYTLADMERTESINVTNESVRLVVERTYFDGPARVTVVDAETGEPLDTTVRVAGEAVGATGDDGVLWVVEPADPYTVTVTVDGTTLSGRVVNT